VRTPVVEN